MGQRCLCPDIGFEDGRLCGRVGCTGNPAEDDDGGDADSDADADSDSDTDGFPYDSKIITCTDQDPKGDDGAFHADMDETVTQARPGRRFVEVAREFGKKSYVYSICNGDWSEAMKEITNLLIECIIVE